MKFLILLALAALATAEVVYTRSDKFGKDYYYSSDRKDFYGAKKFCEIEGGLLVGLGSAAEEDYVITKISKGSEVWLGAQAIVGTQTFISWLDGSRMVFKNWFRGQPDCSSECCAAWLDNDNTWMAAECASLKAFVCEKVHEPTESPLIRYFKRVNDTLDDHVTRIELLKQLEHLTRSQYIAAKDAVLELIKNGTDKVSIGEVHELIQGFNTEIGGVLLEVEALNRTLKKSNSILSDLFQQIYENFTKITNDSEQYFISNFTDLLSTVYANSQEQNGTSSVFSQINNNFHELKTFCLSINSQISQQFAEIDRSTYALILNQTIAFQQNNVKREDMRDEMIELNRRLNNNAVIFNVLYGFAIVGLIASLIGIVAYFNKKTHLSADFSYRIPIVDDANC